MNVQPAAAPRSHDVLTADDSSATPSKSLLALAPVELRNYRKSRSVGDEIYIDIKRLAGRDQEILHRLYASLTELLYAIADASTDDAEKWQQILHWIERQNLDTIIDEVLELGLASHAGHSGEEQAKAIHDVRGGALNALLGRLQLLDRMTFDEANLRILFVLTRDHLKIMRSAIVGLDEPRRTADCQPKSHDVRFALEKWHDSAVGPNWYERSLRLFIDCRHEGALSECCLESAAVDRIVYNLVNNAGRHAVGDRLEMSIFPVPDAAGTALRFVLSNQVSERDADFLADVARDGQEGAAGTENYPSIFTLFEPQVSSTGSGFGLTVVADFVAEAFGLRDRREALRERYVGATLEGQTFRVWFHWPVADDTLPPKLDDYHQPEQSLSEP